MTWRALSMRTLQAGHRAVLRPHGGAVQVDPIKQTLKPPGTKRLKLKYYKLLSSVAFNFNLRRYTEEMEELKRSLELQIEDLKVGNIYAVRPPLL